MKNLNKYILGDAFEHLKKINDKSVDLVMTSIPDLDELGIDDTNQYNHFITGSIGEIVRIVKDDGFVVMCQTDRKKGGEIILKHISVLSHFTAYDFKVKDYKILVKDNYEKVNIFRLNFSHILVLTKKGKIPTAKRKGDYLKDLWLSKMPKNKNFWESWSTSRFLFV